MNAQEFITRITALNVWKKGGQRAPTNHPRRPKARGFLLTVDGNTSTTRTGLGTLRFVDFEKHGLHPWHEVPSHASFC